MRGLARTPVAAVLAAIMLTSCGQDKPTEGSTPVTGDGPEWRLASSQAETVNDGYDVLATLKITAKSSAGEMISPSIVGDLILKGETEALVARCTVARVSLQRWSSGVNDVTLRCPGVSVDRAGSIKAHEK